MALNPVAYTEKVVGSFLRYQLTAYPFMDERLRSQMRELLSLDETRQSPLLQGPYVSLSRPFRQGAAVKALVADGLLHPLLRERIPEAITHLYSHQEEAIRAVADGRTTLVSTGTGSGKTECFLYPIISKCLQLRDKGVPPGISAVIVYPMNALAEDQLLRIRDLLAGTGVSFGIYVGKTPEGESDVTGRRLPAGSSRADYSAHLKQAREDGGGETVYPPEEVCSREAMRTPGRQPRILLTNVKQLELLLTRRRDIELFANARLDYLVFDEAHTFSGAMGAESACLLRRLQAYCKAGPKRATCIATSATIVDRDNPEAARNFAARFFGVAPGDVTTVGEDYEAEVWSGSRFLPPPPEGDDADVLDECVRAVEEQDPAGASVQAAYRFLSGRRLQEDGPLPGNAGWREVLHTALSRNEVVYALNEELAEPRALDVLPRLLEKRVGRAVSQAEILSWLALGAAARLDGRPLLRPVVHAFVRGVGGAVVSFPNGTSDPKLWLAAEDEAASNGSNGGRARFPVATCTTCGQHYFVAFLKDFTYTGAKPGGGNAGVAGPWWERLDEKAGGKRVLVTDRLIGDEETDADGPPHKRTARLAFCRRCGAAHANVQPHCSACGRADTPLELLAVRQNKDRPGLLTSCLSCGAIGRRSSRGRYREPVREVRAVNVADVHVLSQDMVQHAERRRLLVFCDNRQDAAFQAGWMKDHARRFRLRALMSEGLRDGRVSVGDLTGSLDDRLDGDESLSRALIPEVWQVDRAERAGVRHRQERRKYLRMQVLREMAMSGRQAHGLEPWGRMKVQYDGLNATDGWIQRHAHLLGIPPDKLLEGVAGVLDYLRRKRALYDPVHEIFTKHWMEGDREVQQGYLPGFLKPNATKLRREPTEKSAQVTQWISVGRDTTMRQIARKWGVNKDSAEPFLEGLFQYLVDGQFLVPVRLKGSKGRPIPGVSGVYQVSADKLLLDPNRGVWRCRKCRRNFTRDVPRRLCPAWRCDGRLSWVKEDADDYNLHLLDGDYSMLRPEEHTAMVPPDERDRLENRFKGESDAVNCLVCTPTLELGIDIGRLDSVLMRNVPPLPANYWQRAGRAGRRHRMAVNVTYCRAASHDHAYFSNPLKLLGGKIDPPAFNLRNEIMVEKHVHAIVIGALYRYSEDEARPETDRTRIRDVLDSALPRRVTPYLFDGGEIRGAPFDFGPLRKLVEDHAADLTKDVRAVFKQGWPQADAEVVSRAALRGHVRGFAGGLEDIATRLRRRLEWAMGQIGRLNKEQERRGALDPPDEALRRRCDRLVKQLKGTWSRRRKHAEGHDDSNTFGVLAAEGFLPGYGLETGAVSGWAEVPFWQSGPADFRLPRPPATALREYVPGNLIYANGHRFAARRFHRDANEDRTDMAAYAVSRERRAVAEVQHLGNAAPGTSRLRTMAVCDTDLVHMSHISDEEDLRFQLGVAVVGVERGKHIGGQAFRWGAREMQLRRGVRLRLVNAGPATALEGGHELGYPVCGVCGQSVSPFASHRQREEFDKSHEERCRRKPEPVGFHADVVADVLSLPGCVGQASAYSVVEALRFGAARVLDMHMEDLQVLVVGHMHEDAVDALLWDPMPGGSGLLERVRDRFEEVVKAAQDVVDGCPARCESSCTDCLQTFRNAYYHRFLDRKKAAADLAEWGRALVLEHDIPDCAPDVRSAETAAMPVNDAETKLRQLLLCAGFPEGVRGEQIRLDAALGTTTPDVVYRSPSHDPDEGVCIYLDGLGRHLHGNPDTAKRDMEIRGWLRSRGYDVMEIAVHDLADREAMVRHFRRLARYLNMGARADELRDDPSWFADAEAAAGGPRPLLKLIKPEPAQRYVGCVPFVPLKAAAGAFGEPGTLLDEDEGDWLEFDAGRSLGPGMFAILVEGQSMEPRIPSGSYCLFKRDVAGSRQGRVLLVQLLDQVDPETGYRFTVKRYRSEKVEDAGGWRHVKVALEPENPEFQPIHITTDDEEAVAVVAELVAVLGQ